MTTRPASRSTTRVGDAPRLTRHLRLPRRPDTDDPLAAGRRDLVIATTAVVGLAVVLGGPSVWLVAILLLAATILGTLQVVGQADPSGSDRGIPIETVFLPAIAATGCLAATRLVPLGPAIVPALLATGVLIDRALAVEAAITAASQGPTAEDRSRATVIALVAAFVAFAGVAAVVPGGLAGLEPAGAPSGPLPLGDLVLLALADAVVAGLLGYRSAALRGAHGRDALWAALTCAAAIAVGAAAIRAMGVPRLIGPALLMLLFYLWDTLHATSPSRRRDPRWIWEIVVLAGLGALVAFWNLRLVG